MPFETSFDILGLHSATANFATVIGPAERQPARTLRHRVLRPPSPHSRPH